MTEITVDSAKEASKNTMNFFKFVFDFNDENKNMMMNMIQYAVLTIIPVLVILKITRAYVPEVDEEKGSLEILGESLFQIIFIVLSFWFINRAIYYIPTYSGLPYKEFNETGGILFFIFILLTIQTKLGEKLKILSDRVMELWNGDSSLKEKDQKGGQVRVKQPLSHQPSQADNLNLGQSGAGLGMPHPQMTSLKSHTNEFQIPKQSQPDFNQMYQSPNPPVMEPMAANEMGGMFGTMF
jgi:hypothetical protein